MATSDNYFTQYLEDETNKERFNDSLENSTFLDLIDQKREDLGLKAEQKKLDFVNQTINLEEGGFDADTLNLFGRLASQPGFSFDAYETAHYDENNELIPYLGKIAPIDGSKRSKKWNLHRSALAKKLGIPRDYVTQGMLNEEAAKQAQNFKDLLYKGQDPDSPTVSVDIRQDGVGFFGRPLITVRNPITGDIINEVMNTPENNAMFYSKYNKEAYAEGVLQLADAERSYNKSVGQGFWDSMGKGISSGVDNLQATGYGFAALIADFSGSEKLGNWFLDQYLRNIKEAQKNGTHLPGIEDIDWSNPTQVLSKLGALIGEAMPSIALMIGTGGIVGLVAKSAAKHGIKKFAADRVLSRAAQKIIGKAANKGRAVGAYGSAMGMETGSIYGDVAEAGERDWKAQLGSLAGGTIAGALEAFYPLKLMRKLGMGKAGSKTLKSSLLKNSAGQNLKNIGKELLSGGLTEGTTEGLQFIVEEVAQDLIKEGHLPDYKSKEFQLGLLNSVVAGLVPGATFSGTMSTVSEINNRIGGDRAALQRNLQEVRQEANEARDEAAQGTGDIETEKILTERVNSIENQAEALGIELDDTYNTSTNLQKALFLSDALNQLEIEQKALPKGERNAEVLKAKETINTALEQLNTGSAGTEAGVKSQVIQRNLQRQVEKITKRFERLKEKFPQRTERYEAEQAKQIAKAEQVAANKQAKIDSKARRVSKVGVKVLRKTITESINKIKKINAKLKDPNISERQRKRLERTRNQLGIQIDNLSKDNTGQRIAMPKADIKNIETALNSFTFKNKRVKTKTNKELTKIFSSARKVYNDYVKTKDELSQEDLEDKKATLIDEYEKINAIITSLIADRENTNDPAALKELDLLIATAQQFKEDILAVFETEESSKPKPKKPETKPKDETKIVKPKLSIPKILAKRIFNFKNVIKLGANGELLNRAELIEALMAPYYLESNKNQKEKREDYERLSDEFLIDIAQKDKKITQSYIDGQINRIKIEYAKKLQKWARQHLDAQSELLDGNNNTAESESYYADVWIPAELEALEAALKYGGSKRADQEIKQRIEKLTAEQKEIRQERKNQTGVFAPQETNVDETLDSLDIDILNEGVDESILGSLNKEQKKQATIRNKVKDSFNKIKTRLKNAKKSLQDVHNEIIKGTGTEDKFKGIETYLEDAKNDEFTESQYDDFVLGLVLKLKAWKKAQAIFKRRKSGSDTYVDKNTYEVYSSRKQLPDSNLNNYWYINEKSGPLIALLELEIEYAKDIKAVIANILDNVDSKVKTQKLNTKIIANQKKIDALIAKNQGNTGNLDNVKKPVTKSKGPAIDGIPIDVVSKYLEQIEKYNAITNTIESNRGETSEAQQRALDNLNEATYKTEKKYPNIAVAAKKLQNERIETTKKIKLVFPKFLKSTSDVLKLAALGTDIEVIQEIKKRLNYSILIQKDNIDRDSREYVKKLSRAKLDKLNKLMVLVDSKLQSLESSPVTKPKVKPKKEEKITSDELLEIILEEDELIDEDISTLDITKPKDKKVRAKRNKRLKAYQDRHQKLIDKLIADKKVLIDIIKGSGKKGTKRALLNRVEIQDEIDALELKIKLHQAELNNLLKAEFKEKAGNHFLTKFGNTFTKLRDTVLRVTDLFRIRDIERDSFFSINENKNLDKRAILELLKKVGLEAYTTNKDGKKIKGKDYEYIKALLNQFDEFKNAFEKINVGFDDKQDSTKGLYAKEAFKLFLNKEGNMPDEVIFAMMLSTMHYAAVNVGKSKFRPLFEIADLLYGDGKQADRLGKEEIGAWGNAGIFTKNVGKDIGLEMLDILNLQVEKDSEKEFIKNITRVISKSEDSTFRGVIIRDSGFRNTAAMSLGLLAMQTARLVNLQKTKKDSGLFRLRRGSYAVSLFDNPNMGFLNELQKTAEETGVEQFIEWNTIEINDSDLLKIFADNVENLEKIKGSQSDLSDISFVPPKIVQEKTDNSFFVLGKKIINLIRNLQNVKWIGKENELDLFNSLMNFDKNGKLVRDDEGQIVINDVLKQLIGYKNLDEQHVENRDAIEAANDEKLKDIEYIIDYYQNKDTKGLKGFYFRYKAQTQHRLRINSNTINPQRSKIMRALFNPVGSESTVTTDSDKAIFKLAVVQAFGYNIKTLKEGVNVFKQIYENTAVQEAINATPETFQNILNEVLNITIIRNDEEVNLVEGASTHILEALSALKNYSETESFTTTIGIETDGITNGYAIGLLQFLDGTPKELKEALERVGVFVDQKDVINTYEKFIASGKDDVYQAFSRKIVEDIQALGFDISDSINVLHGKLLDKDGALSKFARDLAKNPVMISNYGAGVIKVINNVIGKIIPDLYDTLAKHQTAYNKATTKEERKAITKEVIAIQVTLKNSIKVNINLWEKLQKNELYDFKFSKDRKVQGKVLLGQQSKIEIYFQSIYADKETKIFRNALDTLLAPIKASREILTKIVEAEFFIFYSEFEKQTAEFPSGKLTNTAIRMHIAAQLADKLMPRMNSPWNDPANEQELIQLIKQVDVVAGRVVIRTKPFKNAIYSKTSKKWEWIRNEDEVRVGANSATSDFATPGVSAVINMIQNMDSVVLGDLLDQKNVTKALPIYDAVISPIKDALKNAGLYNKSFLNRNLNHVMLENALEQYDKLLANAKEFDIDLSVISGDLKINSYRGKQIVAELLEIEEKLADKEPRIKNLKNKKDPIIKQTDILKERQITLEEEQAGLTIEGLRETLIERIQSRKDNLKALIDTYGPIDTWVVSQMYLPESVLDSSLTPKIEPKIITKLIKKVKKKVTKIVKTGLTGNVITQETIDGFKGAKDAAIWLANNKDESKYIRGIAKLLIPLLDDTTEVSSDFDRYDESEDFKKTRKQRSFHQKSNKPLRPNIVVINPERGTTVLLHELIHAASQVILKTKSKNRTIRQNNAVKQMWKIRESIIKEYELDISTRGDITSQEDDAIKYLLYGGIEGWNISQVNARKNMSGMFGNPEGLRDSEALAEFLTQTLTSLHAQSYLKRKTIKNKTVWSKLVKSIRNLLNIKDDSLFDEALSISIEGIEALKEEDQRSQGDLFDNTDKIPEIQVADIIANAKKDERIAKEKLSPFTWTSFIKELNEDEIKIIGGQNLVENYKNKEIVDFINNPTKLDKAVKNADPGMAEDGPDPEAEADFEFLSALQTISNRLNKSKEDPIDFDTLDSIDDIVDAELERDVYSTNSLRENLTAIFDRLGLSSVDAYLNKGDQNVQEGHLKRVLTEIIAKAGILLDDTTVTLNASSVKAHGEANIGETSVDVNFNKFKPESYSEQTAQEVYVHELLHILTRFALTKDSRLRQKLERIRNEVKAEIEKEANPYELFLRKDANGKIITLTDEASEIAAAKAQYNYLFGDKVPADAVLDEFLAYSLTNKFMVEKLNTMDSKTVPLWSKEESDSVVEKILHFFTEIIERISGVLRGKTKPANLEQEIFELTKDIVAVNQSKRDELARALKIDKINGVMDKGNAIVRQFAADVASGVIKKGSDAYIAAVDKITKDGKIKGFLADVLYDSKLIAYFGSSYKDFVDNHPKVQEKLNVIFRNFKPNTLKNLSSFKADLFGGVDQDFIKLLYKSHNEIDSNRRQYKELTKEALQKVFKDYDSLTNPEKESLTKVFLKTDLSILVSSEEFTTEQVIELIQDETALDKLVLDYRKKLKINKNQHYRLQTSQLAKIMMTGKNNSYNQMLNASNIYAKGKKKNRAYPKNKKDDEIRDLDIYISLLALRNKNLSNAKSEVTNVIKREFDLDSTHNGIHGLVNLHISFKKESLKEGFNNNPTLMTKGYISSITDPDVSLVVEPDDDATNAEMLRRKYVLISKIDGVGAQPWNLWVIKNNPELKRTKGIVSMTSKQFKGTSLKEIFSRNQSTANAIMDNLNKFTRAQTKKEAKGLLSSKYTAIPVINEKLEIVDYRITMNHAMAEKHLHQELSFDEVLPTMFSQLQDKIKSEQINEEAIKLLYNYGKKNYKNNPSKFINILDERFQKEYYQPLPKQAKYQISKFVTINKETRKEEFWVERGYLDTVFGYVNPSISNISFFNNKPKTKRYAKVTEKLIQEMVRLAVVNIVIKIPIVPAVNFASNFVTSFLYTGDPIYLIKKWREGIVELNKYKHDSKTLKLLDIEILSNPALENNTKTQKKREILVKRINRNPVSGFVDAGLFTSITEDINQNEFTYRNKVFNRIKAKGNKLVTGKVFDVANHAYLGEHTAVFKASMHFLQMSDFIARYALYKHQVEVKGISKDQAWKTMVETFVNYDQPLNRFVGYGNDMGAILFVKYWLRIQRAGINLIKEKPLNVSLLFATQGLLGMDIETILDSSLLAGNFFPTLGGFEKIFEEVFIPPGLEILAGEGFG